MTAPLDLRALRELAARVKGCLGGRTVAEDALADAVPALCDALEAAQAGVEEQRQRRINEVDWAESERDAALAEVGRVRAFLEQERERVDAARAEIESLTRERDKAVKCMRHNAEHLADFELAAYQVREAFFPGGTIPSFTANQAAALGLLRAADDGIVSPAYGVGECKTRLLAAESALSEAREEVARLRSNVAVLRESVEDHRRALVEQRQRAERAEAALRLCAGVLSGADMSKSRLIRALEAVRSVLAASPDAAKEGGR